MRAFVTGGAGFLGSHLVDRLLEDGAEVAVLDDLRKGTIGNLQGALGKGGFVLEEGDVRHESAVKRVARLGPFDVVYHLAAMHFIPECVREPGETLSVNLLGTQAVLQGVECRRFVLASTADVYSSNSSPHTELDEPGPTNIYGLSKLFAEQLLDSVSHAGASAFFVVTRLFNVYGTRETNPHVIPQMIQQLRTGRSLRLGNLWPRRDYVYVADVVDALAALGESDLEARFEVFNVGTGVATSVEEVIHALNGILGVELRVEVDPESMRAVDRPHLQADPSKLSRAIGWKAARTITDGLKELCLSEGLLR